MLRSSPAWMSLIALLTVVAVLHGCRRQPAASRTPGPLRVIVTVPPLAGIVKPLLPADAQISTLIPPGRSEHGYEFTPKDVAAVAQADVVVYVGLGLEPRVESYLERTPSPIRRDVCFATVVGIAEDAHDHGHDHDHAAGEHDHAGPDPHLWLDPSLVARLVPAVQAAAGAALPPESRQSLAASSARLLTDIESLDAECRAALEPFRGRSIVTHHAAWGRFADRYGLKVAAVIRPVETAEPTPEALNEVVAAIRASGATVIFVEPQFSAQAAERIAAAAGVKVATIDPLGDGDWFKLMRENTRILVESLGR